MATAYLLTWPAGRPRTISRRAAAFRHGGGGGARVSLDVARDRLEEQLTRLKATNAILSMNIRLTLSGRRDMATSRTDPVDTGVAVYFDLGNVPHVLACDRWNRVADNIAAVAAHIDALRGQERWGVADLKQAFAGHVALPAPPSWWSILGLASADVSRAAIDAAYRAAALRSHPDTGGDRAEWDRVTAAYEAGKAAR